MSDSPWPPAFDIQGHRGARGLLPENSIPAFRRALTLGVDSLEMDVVISSDEQVVVSHDPHFSATICRKPNGDPIAAEEETGLALFQMHYEEIRCYDCGSSQHPDFPEQDLHPVRKPLLGEVIEMAEEHVRRHQRPLVGYNIETKSTPEGDNLLHPPPERFTELLVDVIRTSGTAERTTIQSFDPRTLKVARRIAPEIRLSLLVSRGAALDELLQFLGFTPEILSPDYRLVDAPMVERATQDGMQVLPWTVNSRSEMLRLRKLGVAGLITDYPDVAVGALR